MQKVSDAEVDSNLRTGLASGRKALLIGGAGFLGSHLCDRLLAEGCEVICMDSLLTGRVQNIRHLLPHPRFHFVRHDATRPIDLAGLMRGQPNASQGDTSDSFRVDYVLHMASPASPKDYANHPIHTLKAGALGTYYALGLAKACGSVLLLASTSEIYGDPEISPQPETYWGHVNPLGPRSVYDEAKRFGESIAMAYHREHGVKVRIARIFNTYGDRMRLDDGRALPNFMAQALQGKPVTVYGNGSQTRSFCHVSDLIEGLFKLLLSEETGPVNLGNPQEISILELAKIIIELTESKSRMTFVSRPADDPARRRPDISKAKTKLNWGPKIELHNGINQVIPYFRAELANRWLRFPESGWRQPFGVADEAAAQNN